VLKRKIDYGSGKIKIKWFSSDEQCCKMTGIWRSRWRRRPSGPSRGRSLRKGGEGSLSGSSGKRKDSKKEQKTLL